MRQREGGRFGIHAQTSLEAGAIVIALLLVVSGNALAARDAHLDDLCGGPYEQWVCGEILVKPMAGANISEIVIRHGGNATDILREIDFGAIGTWFVIAVPFGHEPEAVVSYRADPEVEDAELNTVCNCFLPPIVSPPTGPVGSVSSPDLRWLWLGPVIAAGVIAGAAVWLLRRPPDRPPKDPEPDADRASAPSSDQR